MSAEVQKDDAAQPPAPLDAQTLGSVLFACAGVYWLLFSLVWMARVIADGLTLDFSNLSGQVHHYSIQRLVGIATLAALPVVLAWLTIVCRRRLAAGVLLKQRSPLSSAPLAAVGVRGLGLCLVLYGACEVSSEGVSVMMLWLDVSSHFLPHGRPPNSLFQLFLGALLAWRARWLVDRLRTTCDIWKPASTPTARSST